jgi:hypothetical protein
MNLPAIRAIYKFEMARWRRTLWQSVVSPVVSTSLYFVVFGAAIGSRIAHIESVMNASFGIYFPRFAGTIYEILSAPISYLEIVIGYVGAAATKSILIGLIILGTAFFFVPIRIEHPLFMLLFLVLTAVTFSLFGFVLGIWADGFERLQIVPLLSRRHFLFDQRVAAHLAEGDAVQPRGLSRQRLPVELLRYGRCERRGEPRHDHSVSSDLPRRSVVDLQDRLPTEELGNWPKAPATPAP